MKKTKHILFLSIISLFCLDKANASCTQEELDAFKQIEDKFTAVYKYDLELKTNTVTIFNPDWDKYRLLVDFNDESTCKNIDGYIICSNIEMGNYEVSLSGKSSTCNDTLKTIKIKVSKYNKYYNEPLCEGIEEFVLCQPTYDKDIDYDTFKSRVNTYKKSKEKENNQEEDNQQTTEKNEITRYIENNLLTIIIISVFTILVVITIILTAKSIKKSRRLEW